MYRVWDSSKNRWLTDYEEVYVTCDGKLFVVKEGLFGRKKLKEAPDGCVLHKFTGLFDMNGTPIFEGDLLDVHFANDKDPDVGIIYFNDNSGQYVVLIDEVSSWYPLGQGACGNLTKVVGTCFEGRYDGGEWQSDNE